MTARDLFERCYMSVTVWDAIGTNGVQACLLHSTLLKHC